ncbi:hypothetical protein BSKO_12409 [Bryopsis sp. KO-2023]|nr:hypothetical protein BSKO_12409 [Bryopsis sp. KO-2023]
MGKKLRWSGVPFQTVLVLLLLSGGFQISSSEVLPAEQQISWDVHASGQNSLTVLQRPTEDKLLLEAVEIGDLEGVKNALSEGANLDTENLNGLMPIEIASRNGYLEIAQFLTDENVKINAKVNDEKKMKQGSSPLRSLLQLDTADPVQTSVDSGIAAAEGDLNDVSPNDQLAEPSPETEDDFSTVVTTVRFRGLDFDEVSMDDGLRFSLESAVVAAISAAAKVAVDSIGIVGLRPGSVIMDVQISFPEGTDPSVSEALLDLLLNDPDAVFSGPEFEERFGIPEVSVSSAAVARSLAPGAEGVGLPETEDLLAAEEDVLVSKGAATPAEEEGEIDDADFDGDLIEKLMVPEVEVEVEVVVVDDIGEAPVPETDIDETTIAEALEVALLAPAAEPDEEISDIEIELELETPVDEAEAPVDAVSIPPAVEPPPEQDDLADEDVSVDIELVQAPTDEDVAPSVEPPIPVIARAPDDNVVTAELRFPNLDFAEVVGNDLVSTRLEAAIVSDLADAAGVDESSVRILDIREGSVIVDAEITLPEGRDPAIADELVQTLELEPEDVFSPDFQVEFGVPEISVDRREEIVSVSVPATESAPVDEATELDFQPEAPVAEEPVVSVAEDADLIEISQPPPPEPEVAVGVPAMEPDDEVSELLVDSVAPAPEVSPDRVLAPVDEDVDLDGVVLDEIDLPPSPEGAISPEPEMEELAISTLEDVVDVAPVAEDVLDLETPSAPAPGPEPKEIPPIELEEGEVVTAQLRFANLDFDEVTGDEELFARLVNAVIGDLADAAGVDESMVRILNITEGSVIMAAEITFPPGRDPAIAEELVQTLQLEPEDIFSPDLQQEFGLPEVKVTSQPDVVPLSPDVEAAPGVPVAEPADELVEPDVDEIPAAEDAEVPVEEPVPEAAVATQLPEDADLEDVIIAKDVPVAEPVEEIPDVAAPEVEISLAPGPEDEPEVDLDEEIVSPVAEASADVVTAQLRFPDLDYEDFVSDEALMARFRTAVTNDLADAAGVDPSSVRILEISPGSVIVDAEIVFPSSQDAGVSEEFVQSLQLEPEEVFTVDFQEEFGLPETTIISAPAVDETTPPPGVEPEAEQIEVVLEAPVEEPPAEEMDLEVDGDEITAVGFTPAPETEAVEGLALEADVEQELLEIDEEIGVVPGPVPEEELLDEGLEIEPSPPPVFEIDELADEEGEIQVMPAPVPDMEEELVIEEFELITAPAPEVEELVIEEIDIIMAPAPEVEDLVIEEIDIITAPVPEVEDLFEEDILQTEAIIEEMSPPSPEDEEDLEDLPDAVSDIVPGPEAETDDDLVVELSEAPVPEPEDFIDETLAEEAPAPETDDDLGLGAEEAPEPEPEAEGVLFALRFADLDFDSVTADPQARADLEASVKAAIAAATGVNVDSVNVLGIRSGSVIVDTAVLLSEGQDVDQVVGAVNSNPESVFGGTQFGVPEVTVTRLPSRSAPAAPLAVPPVIEPVPVPEGEITTIVTPTEAALSPIDESTSVPEDDFSAVPDIEPEAEPGVETELDTIADVGAAPEPEVEPTLDVSPQPDMESSPVPEIEEADELFPTPEGLVIVPKILASIIVDIDFNVVQEDASLRTALMEMVVLQVAEVAGVNASAVEVVAIRDGSAILDTEITLPEDFDLEQSDAILSRLSTEPLFSEEFRQTFGSAVLESAELVEVPVEAQEIVAEEEDVVVVVAEPPTPESPTPEPEVRLAPTVEGVDPGPILEQPGVTAEDEDENEPPAGEDGEEAKSPKEILEEEVDVGIKKSGAERNVRRWGRAYTVSMGMSIVEFSLPCN